MRVFFENQNLFYLSIIVSIIFIVFIYFMKIKNRNYLILQAISCLCLFCILSSPFILKVVTLQKTAFLIDISNSMPKEDIYKRINSLYSKNDEIFLFSKGLTPFPINLGELKDINLLKNSWSSLNLKETNIKNNLEEIIEKNIFKKIVIYTDGYESSDKLIEQLNRAKEFPIKIYPLIPDFSNQKKEISNLIELKVNSSSVEKINHPSKLQLLIKSNKPSLKTNIIVLQNGETIFEQSSNISNLKYVTHEILSKPLKDGINNFNIKILDNLGNVLSTKNINITAIKKETILLLSNSLNDAVFLEGILKNTGFNFISDYGVENNFDNIQKYTAIILNNFPYKKLGENNAKKIENWVRNGGKFIMIGGENSFGVGGYKNTSIENILPVTLQEPQKKIIRLNMAIALILDCSGSMEQDSKIEFLKLAGKKLINNLNDDDYIGVIGFNTNSFSVFPISKIKETKKIALESIDTLTPFGGTNLLPAMNDAIDMLSKVRAGGKHVIILTDGKVPGNVQGFLDTATIIRMTGGTISTILLGSNIDPYLLKNMAKIGKGNFYQTNNISTLPDIFIEDLNLIKKDDAFKENVYNVKTHLLESTSITSFPILKGFVITTPKDDSKVELIVSSFGEEEPLLISKDIDKGKSIAFTSDMNGRWSSEWIKWNDIYLFWEQVLYNFLLNKNQTLKNILDYNFFQYVKDNSLYLDMNFFNNIASKDLSIELLTPSKQTQVLTPNEVALGHFIAKYNNPIKGNYQVTLLYKDKKESSVIFDIEKNILEQKHQTPNMTLLQLLALKSFGKINPNKNDLKINTNMQEKYDISIYFIIFSIVSFFFGVFKREKL